MRGALHSRLNWLWGVVCLVLFVSPSAAATVEGQLFGQAGEPLENQGVVLLEARVGTIFDAGGVTPYETQIARARTDGQGFFHFDLGSRVTKGKLLLRIGRDGKWDLLRYLRPEDLTLGRGPAQHDPLVINVKIEDAPAWKELKHEIIRSGGKASKRGRILRKHGFCPEVLTRAEGTVEWRYPGVTYVFEGGKLLEARRDQESVQVSRAEEGS